MAERQPIPLEEMDRRISGNLAYLTDCVGLGYAFAGPTEQGLAEAVKEIGKLPPRQARVMELVFGLAPELDGFCATDSYAAELVGVSSRTIGRDRAQALKQLRSQVWVAPWYVRDMGSY